MLNRTAIQVIFILSNRGTVEPLVGDHSLCKKKWSPTGGGLSWKVLHGIKRA